jgi:hypothetical protein
MTGEVKMALATPSCNDRSPFAAMLAKAADTVMELGPEFDHYRRKLIDLSNRFSESRFHLAVLGQFKRGKSTLLNALIGAPILPVGVVPLTAASTFIQFGLAPKIRVQCQDSRHAEVLKKIFSDFHVPWESITRVEETVPDIWDRLYAARMEEEEREDTVADF